MVAVHGRPVERALDRLAVLFFLPFLAPKQCRTSRVLILPFTLDCYPGDAGFLAVSWNAAEVTVDGAVVSPGHMQGNPTTHDQGRAIRTVDAVDIQGIQHASNICEVKIPSFIAGSIWTLSY